MNNIDLNIPLNKNVEIMAIGFQSKDVELGIGGILLKMAHRGYTTVICDLTNGDEHSNNKQERMEMAEKAGKVIHISDRINLNLFDLRFNPVAKHIQLLAKCLMQYRPEIILAPYREDWHYSSHIIYQLLQNTLYLTKDKQLDISLQPYIPKWIFYYTLFKPDIPDIVVNITSTFEGKLEAIRSYQNSLEQSTTLSFSTANPEHPFFIESRARHYGSMINCRFGEGLIIERPIPIDDIYELINS